MRLNFRRRLKIAPGVRLNFGKSGVGVTLGGKYGRVIVSPRGQTTLGATIGGGFSVSHPIRPEDLRAIEEKISGRIGGGVARAFWLLLAAVVIVATLVIVTTVVFAASANTIVLPTTAPVPTPRPAVNAEFVDGNRLVIIDADTVALPCAVAFRGCAEKLRLLAIDAAETYRPRCENELILGLAARQRLVELVRGHQVEVIRSGKKDRYGRTLADLHVNGVDIGQTLINEGKALPYRPGRIAWLERAQMFCPGFTEEAGQ